MKFVCLILFLATASSCNEPVKGKNGVKYRNPVQYNDYIAGRQTRLMNNILAFGKMATINHDSAVAMLHRYVGETETMIGEINGMPPYKGDSSLRDAAVSSFIFYKRVFGRDYMEIISIRKKEEDMTEEEKTQINRILENISKEEEGLFKTFRQAQIDFAAEHRIELKESTMKQ